MLSPGCRCTTCTFFSDSVLVSALDSVLSNPGGENLKNVRLELVAALPQNVPPCLTKAVSQINQKYTEAASSAAMDMASAPATCELETLYIFEL